MNKIKKIIDKLLKSNLSQIIIYLVVIFLMITNLHYCSSYNEQKRINEMNDQNIIALNDTIKIEKLKSGELQYSIAGFISNEKNLKKLNNDLYNDLIKQSGNVLSLNNIIFELKQNNKDFKNHIDSLESIINQPVKINDSLYTINWNLTYKWDNINYDKFNGKTTIGTSIDPNFEWTVGMTNSDILKNALILKHYNTELINRKSVMKLTFGQKIEKNQLRIFVNTNYPGFTPESLEGVLIDPNTNKYIKQLMKKRKFFPNTFTIGIGISSGYDLLTKKVYIGPGINLNYNLFQF